MLHELLHMWHITADTQYKIYTSGIIMNSLFRTKTKTNSNSSSISPAISGHLVLEALPGPFSAQNKGSYGGGEIRNGWEPLIFVG